MVLIIHNSDTCNGFSMIMRSNKCEIWGNRSKETVVEAKLTCMQKISWLQRGINIIYADLWLSL